MGPCVPFRKGQGFCDVGTFGRGSQGLGLRGYVGISYIKIGFKSRGLNMWVE